jgi:hypothetical protein
MTRDRVDADELPPPVCDYCGSEIEDRGQQCPALDSGECRP